MTNELNMISENNESTVVAEFFAGARKDESYQSEAALEKEFISILHNQGYEVANILSEDNFVLNLRNKIESLNDFKFTDNEWHTFFKTRVCNGNDGIIQKTKKIQEDYVQNIILENGESKNIKLIEKDKIHRNSLQVFNQYENEGTKKNIYDVTVLVNGLPLVHIELKRRGVNIKEAFNQINRYKRDSFWAGTGLFEYVQVFVISNGTNTKYYSNTTRDAHVSSKQSKKSNTFEFTSFWADAKNKVIRDLTDFAKTFFAKHAILKILTKYCVLTSEERLLVMRPYQIVATEKIINKINLNHHNKLYGKKASGGYVWHTTGSGKTLTSFKTAQLATKEDYINKVLFVVDRKDLDYQTMKEYDRFEKGAANSNSSTRVLLKQLSDPDARIIITTIQKLDKFIKKNQTHKIFDEEIVIIFDECHRSQFGDMHKSIANKFKKHYIFGFTGTPIFKENITSANKYQTTDNTFGESLHEYTIIDAINDKNVLPFKMDVVQSIAEKENIKEGKVKDIDREGALLDSTRITNVTNYIIEHFAQKTKHAESYTFSKLENIKEIAKSNKALEIRNKTSLTGFNSIFAVSSIEAAKKYYTKFKEFEDKGKHNLKVALIYSCSVNENEADGLDEENNEDTNNLDKVSKDFLDDAIIHYNNHFKTNYDTSAEKFQNYYKDVSLRMKNREIDILIVVNMFLTGFDATTLNTLWVDKNLKYHGLIQAFSRTNRILNSIKTYGNIVCFRNLEKNLNDALKCFNKTDKRGIIVLKSYDEYYFGYDADGEKFEGYKSLVERLKSTYPIGEEIYGEKNKKAFVNLYSAILKVRNILSSFDQFSSDTLLTDRELQDYHSMYIDLYHEFRKEKDTEKTSIVEDVVFEMELIKQIEVNIDYILELVKSFAKTNFEDEEILIKIGKSIDSSFELRNKKDLIMNFITSINSGENTLEDFVKYINDQRKIELDKIIENEKLKHEETYLYMKKCFKNGGIIISGTEITKILPPISRFSKDFAGAIKKDKVIFLLSEYFERFYTISTEDF